MRTVESIKADIATNEARYQSLREYFGAMFASDAQCNLSKGGLFRQLQELRAELEVAKEHEWSVKCS